MSAAVDRRTALSDPLARYQRAVEIRLFEDRVNEMFAAGLIHGTTHLCQGQEALAVGLASVTRPDDAVTTTYRGHGIALALGMTVESVLAEIMGRAAGCTGGLGGSMHLCDMDVGLLPTFAVIGAGIPVAVGAALAFQVQRADRVAVAVFGDATTNIGAFHEALNLAAVWHLPVVFVIDNNVYGEYSRWDLTTPVEHLHTRASSYGMASAVVDGMDVDAVRDVIGGAVARARAGGGPTLVEAKTYRLAGHSRADKAPYRPEGELEHWQQRDPVALTRAALVTTGVPESVLVDVETRVRAELDATAERVQALPVPGTDAMFANVWTQLPGRVHA